MSAAAWVGEPSVVDDADGGRDVVVGSAVVVGSVVVAAASVVVDSTGAEIGELQPARTSKPTTPSRVRRIACDLMSTHSKFAGMPVLRCVGSALELCGGGVSYSRDPGKPVQFGVHLSVAQSCGLHEVSDPHRVDAA